MFGIKTYTKRNFSALAEAFIPETPELARELGQEHLHGANNIELADYLIDVFDQMQDLPEGQLRDFLKPFGITKVKISPILAFLLDMAAVELILKQNEESLDLEFELGMFRELSEENRLRAVGLLEQGGKLKTLVDKLKPILPQIGIFDFLVAGLTTFPAIGYYGEWSGYSEQSRSGVPDSESFTGNVQSWDQTGYPGPSDGYAEVRGYELDEYVENDY